jgi:hypothetical protein
VFVNNKDLLSNASVVEYIIKNHSTNPRVINKVIPIADWYGVKIQEKYEIEFAPTKIFVLFYFGETERSIHCLLKYRQNMEPLEMFLPRKAIGKDFMLDDYHNTVIDFDRYDKLSTSKDPNRMLLPHQKEAVQFLIDRKKCILADGMGLGKMEPVSSILPTEYGFKKFGELQIGDNVFGEDGKLYPIVKIFEHKNKEIYKVTFSDGSFSYCGLDHLWKVRTENMKRRNQGWAVKSLKELIDSGFQYNSKNRLKRNQQPYVNKYQIPVCNAVEYGEKEYIIHPYILGMCIGDGNMCNGSINISIPDNEKENAERISNLLPDNMILREDRSSNCPRYRIINKTRQFRNKYISEIKRLGLNIKGIYKFIPDEYKIGSISQRFDLLRGLMDSDGTIGKNNRITFSTNSALLANDVAELVFSLGGIARIGKYTHKNRKNAEYQVRIQIKENPFYLTRKKEKYNPTFKKYCSKYMVSAEFDRFEDARCIMIDYNEHTYLTGRNYIVTHNTTSLSVSAIEGNFDSILIICPASIKTNWKKELLWYVDERDITIIESINDKTKSELEEFLGYAKGKSNMTVAELKKEAEEKGKWKNNRFVIINYDILDRFYQIPKTRSKANIEEAFKNSPMLQYITDRKSLIIIDEAHLLSNNTSIRYKVINDLIKRGKPHSIYLSTGTPITNNPLNLYYLLKLLDDPITHDWQFYVNRYCDAMKIPAKGEKEKWTNFFLRSVHKSSWYDLTSDEKDRLKVYIREHARMINLTNGASNLEELRDKISHLYLRRTKEDLENSLPEKRIHELYYDFTSQQKVEYDKLWDEYEEAQLEADPNKELNKDLLEGAIYRRYCSNQMVPNTIKLADEFISKGEKVVIFCCYDEELYTLRDYYGDKGVIYNGKMSAKEKDIAVDKFLHDDNIKTFVANLDSAGVGITLISACKLIFNNIEYTPSSIQQGMDRIHRIGQTKEVDIYFQFFKDTQYEKIWNTVMRKNFIINKVIKKEDEK